jgi:cellulose synthase/poly-beta-1,6-N-acetylglucosamine synthase-like glycosyltransferase
MLLREGSPLHAGRTPSLSIFKGDRVSEKSLTIVLPINNGEARLFACVVEILELVSELTSQFSVLIVDDGSTDDTFEVAEELASRYPQVSVMRHRHRRGLGPTIDFAQRHIRSDAVIVHDGVSPIDPYQVRNLWRSCVNESTARESGTEALQSAICDFANLPAIHAAMEETHQRVLGFQCLTPRSDDQKEASRELAVASEPRTDAAHYTRRSGMGQIPPLPRPKFVSALANFALGE